MMGNFLCGLLFSAALSLGMVTTAPFAIAQSGTEVSALSGEPMSAAGIRAALVGKTHSGEADGHPYTQDWLETETVFHGKSRKGHDKDFPGTWKITDSGLYRSKFEWGTSYYLIVQTGNCAYRWDKVNKRSEPLNEVYTTTMEGCAD